MSAIHSPAGLLAKHKLLRAVIDADWATRLDHKVASHIIERYRADHGNARASLRYLERATGAARPSIIASLRRLNANAFFASVQTGSGSRPTEFALNFDLGAPASGSAGDTASPIGASGNAGDTSEVMPAIPPEAASGIADDTESLLPVPVTDRVRVGGDSETRAGVPPAAPSTPDGGTGGAARDPFEALWNAYGHKRDRAKAKTAFHKIDAADHEAAITGAARWHAAYVDEGRPAQYRKALHNFLAGECWLEDDPEPYVDRRAAGIAARRSQRAAEPDEEPMPTPAPRLPAYTGPTGRFRVRVTDTQLENESKGGQLALTFEILDGHRAGERLDRVITHSSRDQHEQQAGQVELSRLCDAAGVGKLETGREVVGAVFVIVVSGTGEITYDAAIRKAAA